MDIDAEARSAQAAGEKAAKDETIAHILRQLYLTTEGYFQGMPSREETALGESARIVADEGEFAEVAGFEAWLHDQMLFNSSGIAHLEELGFDGPAIVTLATPLMKEWLYALPDSFMPPEAASKLRLEYFRTDDSEVVRFALDDDLL